MKPKSSKPAPPIGAQCYCGAPALLTVAKSAYCLDHFDDALIAIERIRYDREMAAS